MMKKTIFYGRREYIAEFCWIGGSYAVMIEGVGSEIIPLDALKDLDKIKECVRRAIEKKNDLYTIGQWDGKI